MLVVVLWGWASGSLLVRFPTGCVLVLGASVFVSSCCVGVGWWCVLFLWPCFVPVLLWSCILWCGVFRAVLGLLVGRGFRCLFLPLVAAVSFCTFLFSLLSIVFGGSSPLVSWSSSTYIKKKDKIAKKVNCKMIKVGEDRTRRVSAEFLPVFLKTCNGLPFFYLCHSNKLFGNDFAHVSSAVIRLFVMKN